jgi:hypothetical protein
VTALVGKYHDEHAPGGRKHRLVVALHPSITRRSEAGGDGGTTNGAAAHRQAAGER